ncbi:MAG TPA: transcriptional regulator [Elusimicrobia bacterium]|nr:MAG: transcriptional regulator [Elusimicrobia bacterium RIFOXYA12_FULL_49_49]OGS09256.1 MAG: transcriptional regulator [Elusimicrobia bacterium RIFOXYA1_FULL_47_7]OGS10900.1 MAG: transcriptional regulator [Elusimicrobia bacterium RIFOXYB1_FULL_48_9]OGS16358.1 MAG: transcriptional regulator [Elusimicrobia bacterium RIFOXYA2_FULL_47_53]OGS27262.1 MAG: transcriptional regulator [Elusimicrobia bacterium RIFOXYB12_FULL_50_12]OGS30464.1 MAG: transcriptional regulator [Elusimicrobia bacterium RIFO
MDLQLITCIVERGKADRIIDAALKSGAQAATTFFGRGRGIREKLGVFGMFIKPEKEIVLIVAKADSTLQIFENIVTAGGLREPGKGFAYIQPVNNAVGFIE